QYCQLGARLLSGLISRAKNRQSLEHNNCAPVAIRARSMARASLGSEPPIPALRLAGASVLMVVAARGADFLGSAPKGFKEELARQVSECQDH
ncbi:MAG: hypothetical protein WBZ16_11225, partial [Pseudolabrys sp.]